MSDTGKSTREKAAAARAAAEAGEKRRERTVRIILIAVVVLIVAGIAGATFMAMKKSDSKVNASASPSATGPLPKGVSSPDYGVAVGTVQQPTLEIYEDFQCPACKQFENAMGTTLDEMVAAGQVQVVYHPMNFLDAKLNNTSSTEAAAAFGCAVDAGITQKYHDVVFANQPAQEGAGYTIEQLQSFGQQAGLTGAELDTFKACVQAQTYAAWPTLSNAQASARGVTGTPTLFLNGEKVDTSKLTTVDAFKSQILASASGGSAAPAASASPSAS